MSRRSFGNLFISEFLVGGGRGYFPAPPSCWPEGFFSTDLCEPLNLPYYVIVLGLYALVVGYYVVVFGRHVHRTRLSGSEEASPRNRLR
jgi:hypothetical protein